MNILPSERQSQSSDTFEFDGGFDPSPATNTGLREVFTPPVQPSRREREFNAWQAEGRSSVTRRSLLAASLALLAVPALAFKNAPAKAPTPAFQVEHLGHGTTMVSAPNGTPEADRLERALNNGRFEVEGKRLQPVYTVVGRKRTYLALWPAK